MYFIFIVTLRSASFFDSYEKKIFKKIFFSFSIQLWNSNKLLSITQRNQEQNVCSIIINFTIIDCFNSVYRFQKTQYRNRTNVVLIVLWFYRNFNYAFGNANTSKYLPAKWSVCNAISEWIFLIITDSSWLTIFWIEITFFYFQIIFF